MPGTQFEALVVEAADDESNWHGPHLHIFLEDNKDLVLQIPDIVRDAKLLPSLADNKSIPRHPLPHGEPQGALLVWPVPRQGLILVIHLNAPGGHNELLGFHPWISEGVEHRFTLQEIELFPNRLEARLTGNIGPSEEVSLTFFDTQFAHNRALYRKGAALQVVLTGIPSSFEIYDAQPVVINDIDHIRAVRPVLFADDPLLRDSDEPLEYQTKGMAAFIPRGDIASDYYEFCGPVKSVQPYDLPMFGQMVWRVRVTVMRFDDQEFDLDLCLCEKARGDGRLPEPGDDVRGMLWLQGYLWWTGGGDVQSCKEEA